jgi:hypothetical protein
VARLQFERGFVDSFRHSSFGLTYRWRHPCRLAPRNQLLGSSLPTLGLTGLVLLCKRIPNGLLGFLPARHVFTWTFCVELPSEHTFLRCLVACAVSNSAFPRMAMIGIDCRFRGHGLVARLSYGLRPVRWRPFAGLLPLTHACRSKSALLLTSGQFEPR